MTNSNAASAQLCEQLTGICEFLAELPVEQLLSFKHQVIASLNLRDVVETVEAAPAESQRRLRLANERLQASLAERSRPPFAEPPKPVLVAQKPSDAAPPEDPPGVEPANPPPPTLESTSTPEDRTDDELMSRVQGGDSSAFDELTKRHQPWLRQFFSRAIRMRADSELPADTYDENTADDLVQDVFVKVYQSANQFVPQGTFRAWVFRIARNRLIDRARRDVYDSLDGGRQADDEELLNQLETRSPPPIETVNRRANADMIAALLDELPEEQMLTFKFHIFAGLSLPEVAEVMETSTSTTKSRLRLAREKLQEKLAARGVRFSDEDFA